jgi:membrane protein YqaA with SNARE-associated domain
MGTFADIVAGYRVASASVKSILGTLGYSILGSVVPIFNVEVYLVAIATQIPSSAVIPVSIAAGAGQALGKVVWYHATLRSMNMPWMQKRLEKPKFKARYERWHKVVNGHPWTGAGLTFASGLVGVPPLLVMGVLGGALRMNQFIFFTAIFLGRTLQSWAILAGLTSLLGLTSLGH